MIIIRNLWFFFLGILFALDVLATIAVFQGGYGVGEKVVSVIVLIVFFLWMVPRSISFFSDIIVPRVFCGRKIYVEQSGGGYDMMKVVDSLNRYLSEQGAIIADNSSGAEFRITLTPDLMEPMAISCRLIDQQGYKETFREYGQYWPRSFGLAVAKFIRISDRRSVA